MSRRALRRWASVGEQLRTATARWPLLGDLAVPSMLALVSALAWADDTFDATVTTDVTPAPAAIPWLLYVGFTVPLLWRRTHPQAVLWVSVAVAGVMVWWGLDHTSALCLPVAVYSVAVRRPILQLAGAGTALLAEVGLAGLRWGSDAAASYLVLLVFLVAATLLGQTVRVRRQYLASLRERAVQLEVERDQRARLAVAAERARMAREVHDIVARNLAVMVALADGATFALPSSSERAADMMGKAAATGREALGEMRRLVGVLRGGEPDDATTSTSPTLADPVLPGGPNVVTGPQPGLADLDGLVDQVRAAGLRVTFRRTGANGVLGPGAGLAVYRIVQEALTNTLKHAGSQAQAHVQVHCTATRVDLEVTDDGGPSPAPVREDGHGLVGMVERAATYGGRVQAGPRPGGGWRVQVRLELDGDPR